MRDLSKADCPEFAKRFWSKVAKTDDCWLWTGSINTNGYGRFGGLAAHRIAYYLRHGMPTQPILRHQCNVRNCVNPDHLIEGTHQQNSDDMVRSMRTTGILTSDIVHDIRAHAKSKDDHPAIGRMMIKYNISSSVVIPVVTRERYKWV